MKYFKFTLQINSIMLKKLNPKTRELVVPLLSIIFAAGIIVLRESDIRAGRSAMMQGVLFFLIIISNLVYVITRFREETP